MHLQNFFFVPDPPPPITIPGISDCGSALPVKSFVKAAILLPKAAILLVSIKDHYLLEESGEKSPILWFFDKNIFITGK